MTTTAICLFAAMLTTGLLTGIKNSCKRGYIIPDRFDIHCEIISMHIANILKENELYKDSVVKEFLTTAADGKNYNVLQSLSSPCNWTIR